MNRFIKVVFCLVVLSVFCLSAAAQRMTPGRPSIEAQVLFGENMGYRPVGVNGVGLTWNNHQYIGHTSLGLDFYTHPYDYLEKELTDSYGNVVAPEITRTFRCYDITAGGGYMFRVISARSRVFILSAGAGIYPGIRYCKEIGDYIADESKGKHYSPVGFLLNLVPEVQAEVFPFSNVSLYVSARPRFQLVSTLAGHYDWFRFSWGFGVKLYL